MNKKELLPIGSVVLLKNANHRIMIIGYSPLFQGKKMMVYDYSGTFYPEGQLKPDQQLVFNNKDIDKIFAQGFSDDSEKEFRSNVEKIIDQVRDENGYLTATPEQIAKLMENGGE